MKLIVGITGATGVIYAIRLLEALRRINNVKAYLIMSEWAKKNLEIETVYTYDYIESLADEVFDNGNLGSKVSSGSFITDGMIIVPCSMKSLSSIANGYCESLISRAADVVLKEGKKLVLCPRETPLNAIHLENMLKLSRLGVRIVPPMPAFYNRPETLEDIINHHVMKILDQFGIETYISKRWNG
ncbi:UbiX family flavin prenyltransferase [Ruminiclostridium herbifermentans]|uniref:Flavin prenyltransferase UbiX n=1 Tax=Ruminiclostridium herbifermentans TaxID=2488810 RepID=A0A4U7JHT7_9FIRM|nr:UbiX family flavin prenyltransferase [Ruminiclostridium herbifermentans]QNU66255.1 UbiX family flavin prenyltransferase [Ruminiclostridium herbifermentans]